MSERLQTAAARLNGLVDYLPPRSINLLLLHQLSHTCSGCAAAVASASVTPAGRSAESSLAAALGLNFSEAAVDAYKKEMWDLLRRAPEDRIPTVRVAKIRFRSPGFVVFLLTQAQRERASSPGRALELATAAVAVAEHGTRDPALTALALAHVGNVHRTTGRLELADPCIEQAFDHLDRFPQPPLWLRAELLSLHGSLLKDHRHFVAAEECLLDAAAMFHAAGDQERGVRVRLKVADVHHLRGDPQSALLALRRALEPLDPWAQPALHLAALHNLAVYLCAADQPTLARDLMTLVAPLYQADKSSRPRHDWLAGLIAKTLGDLDDAERSLRSALERFIDAGSPVYAALVVVDLAELMLAQGRASEVVEVTRHLPGLFKSLDVHPEAVAATLLFHKAAAEMKINEEYVAIFRRFLERADVDRSVQFHPPAT